MKSKLVSREEIQECLNNLNVETTGKSDFFENYTVSSLNEAQANSIVWYNGSDPNVLRSTASCFIVCLDSLDIDEDLIKEKTFLKTKNPKLLISEIIKECFSEKVSAQIHESAFIHPEAKIGKNAFIGPFVYIGKAEIGDNAVIWGHVYIHDNAIIGNNVEIHAGCVIGEIGSGFTKNEQGEYIKFPHIGGVIIEDDVEVGAQTYINRGSLSDTWIRRGAKIGNSVCIGHNVEIGEDSMVIANTVVAGSAKLGKNCWIAHSCSIRNGITLGDNVFIGMGSVVTSSCPSNTTLFGNPAKDFNDIKKWKAIQKALIEERS